MSTVDIDTSTAANVPLHEINEQNQNNTQQLNETINTIVDHPNQFVPKNNAEAEDRNKIDKNDSLGVPKTKKRKHKHINKANANNNQKLKMRPPQQTVVPRKLHRKSFKAQLKNCDQAIRAELKNIYNPNAKNQANHRQQQQHPLKNTKHNFSKLLGNRAAQCALRSKFFLPAKRPRKDVMIPPTKFLLGGNISDPLNLNGLQNESQDATPVPTPHQSPITTPPKVEVIIPPNIFDPLHLLDPVDSLEYEKQLVSPMKRKSKHRHRKKKPKQKSSNENDSDATPLEHPGANVTCAFNFAAPSSTLTTEATFTGPADDMDESTDADKDSRVTDKDSAFNFDLKDLGLNKSSEVERSETPSTAISEGSLKREPVDLACKHISATSNAFAAVKIKEKVRDLKLDLSEIGSDQHSIGSGGGRKRRISEGPNKNNKFRRLDSMDRIVSPVVPQPGAWKRPPRTVSTGGRKTSRHRSTSVSENELISPTDELKTFDMESIRCDTPESDTPKFTSKDEMPNDSYEMPSFEEHQRRQFVEKLPKFRRDGERYKYGNFDRYSGYRNINEMMDVRLEVFHRNAYLFRGKDILDIGCNAGHITIAVAKDLAPKSILGVDIDKHLIERARRNLSMFVRIPKDHTKPVKTKDHCSKETGNKTTEESKVVLESSSEIMADASTSATLQSTDKEEVKLSATSVEKQKKSKKNLGKVRKPHQSGRSERGKVEFFPISFPISYGGLMDISSIDRKENSLSQNRNSSESRLFPKNVFFKTANYVLKDESLMNNDTQQYDVILCLSVTKWIHLNFGDAGLKQAFKRMFNQLRPGGKLILEAQNWASYKKKKNLTETIYSNYRSIEFFPNKFHEYLLGNEVGFSHSYCLGAPRHMNKGFCRPIQLYAKGDYTPNHIRWSDDYHPQTPYEPYRGIYAGMARPPPPFWGPLDTPRGNSGSYSVRQTPVHSARTSQYYNPLESDSYLPSYDTEVQNRHYVFASPLYHTVWSPPASMRNSANKTPVFGSIREVEADECVSRHVYPPNECSSSPQASSSNICSSIREPDNEDSSQQAQSSKSHVYANCDDSTSSPADNSSSPIASRNANGDHLESNDSTENEMNASTDTVSNEN